MRVNLKYKIGSSIKTEAKVFTVIGFEYVEGRAIRYILLHSKEGIPEWSYMYDFEIENIKLK